MAGRDFASALHAADRSWAEAGLPPGARRRLDDRLLRARIPRLRGSRWWPGWAAFLPATAALVGALLMVLALHRRAAPLPIADERAGFLVALPSADLVLVTLAGGAVDVQRGSCTLEDEAHGIVAEVSAPARLRRRDDAGGVAVELGTVAFSVEHRAPGDVRRVVVSGGTIEITGTHFTVRQGDGVGSVELHEGSIRFIETGHDAIELRPGDSVAWPSLAKTPEPEVAPPEKTGAVEPDAPALIPSVHAPSQPARRDDAVIAKIEALRAQGRFAEAAALAAASPGQASSTQERLSFERGSLLTYQLHDRDAACAQWARHERSFPNGRYAVEVASARRFLLCR